MNQITQFFKNDHKLLRKSIVCLCCLEAAYTANNQQDIEKLSKEYAELRKQLAAPQVEQTLQSFLTDEQIEEMFSAGDKKVRITMHEEIKLSKPHSIAHNLSY